MRAGNERRLVRRQEEAGFTIVEVIVASLVLVLGVLATLSVLQAAARNTERAKGSQVARDKAQQELEALRGLTSTELAMTANPSHSASPANPNYRVSGGTFAISKGPPPSTYATMVVNGSSLFAGGFVAGGVVSPGPVAFTSGNVTGKVYRYVVWRNDPNCPTTTCSGGQDYKQIIVAVKLDQTPNSTYDPPYVEVQSNFIDPTDSVLTEPPPGANGVVTAQQFYLSDTPCQPGPTATTTRQDIVADHLLHNTLGTCASGLQNGTAVGAPDVLMLGAPPIDQSGSSPPLRDYSDDFYLEPSPDTDKGVQIRREDTAGCAYNPAGATNPESQVHRWVTDPMPASFVMTGTATLEFYTRTINDSLHTGRLCVYLFKRHEAGTPLVATDTMLQNNGVAPTFGAGQSYFGWSPAGSGNWPRFSWTKERLTVTYPATTIAAGDRLGVALSVDRAVTPADAIPIMYDHPDAKTRLEVDTNTPLEGE